MVTPLNILGVIAPTKKYWLKNTDWLDYSQWMIGCMLKY
jgi:hypothetical protein